MLQSFCTPGKMFYIIPSRRQWNELLQSLFWINEQPYPNTFYYEKLLKIFTNII